MIWVINDKIIEPQKTTFKLLVTPDALLAAPLYFYAGFSLSFFSGIFSTSIGNTKVGHLFQTMQLTAGFTRYNSFIISFSMMQQAFLG